MQVTNKQKTQPLRICHVITRMIVGGAQENTLLTVRGLKERGHDTVLLTGPTEGPEGQLLETAQFPGLEVVEEPMLTRELHPWKDLRAFFRLYKFFRQRKFDVVHTHSSKAGIIGRLAARRAGCPLIVHTVHGQAFHSYEKWWRNKIYIAAERFAAKYSDHIFAVAQAMIEQCVQAGVAPRAKYSVVYSGMDLKPYLQASPNAELRQTLGIPPDAPVVGKIARLFELKGHEDLIAAASDIVREIPDVRFLLVGDGKLRPKLEHEIDARGLKKHFIFAGLVPPGDIPRYISLMDVLVHLSLREGLPRTVVQALAGGKPAVAYNLDGTPEVIVHGTTGYLCAPQSIDAVRDYVTELLKSPEKAREMGQNGRALVKDRFDWEKMVQQLETAYFHMRQAKK